MSNPGEQPETPSSIEQDGSIPETVIPDNAKDAPKPEPEEPAPAAAKTEEKPAEPEKPKRTPWYMERIGELTRKNSELNRKLEAKPADAMPVANDEQKFYARAKEEAKQELAQENALREFRAKAGVTLNAGNKEFGAAEFAEKCNVVANMGFGDRTDFMEIVTDPDIIPDGHKLLSALADDPDEAQKIARLPPAKMAAALVRYQNTMKQPEKPISSAPAPIKPIGGTAKPSTPNDTDDIKAWMAKRNATARTTAGGKPNTH
jgi:hypothetical protein